MRSSYGKTRRRYIRNNYSGLAKIGKRRAIDRKQRLPANIDEPKMRRICELIPDELAPRVEAAVAWFNSSPESAGETFTATGILDPDETLRGSADLRLILCGGNRCEQHSFRVTRTTETWSVEFLDGIPDQVTEKLQSDLDPPPGARLSWLDNALLQHTFVVLLFYRGFW